MFPAIFRVVLVFAIGLASASLGTALAAPPDGAVLKTADDGQVIFITELGAMLSVDGDKITVKNVTPPDERPEKYEAVDLEDGDVLMMMNGTRVKSAKDFQDLYMKLDTGEIVRLGISRGGNMMIVSFEKGDSEELPQRQLMIMSADVSDGDSTGERTIIRIGPEDGEIALITEAGVVFKKIDDGLVADKTFPTLADLYSGDAIKKGDKLVSVDGKKVGSADDVRKIYNSAQPGDELELVLMRDGKPFKVTIKKSNKNLQIRRESM